MERLREFVSRRSVLGEERDLLIVFQFFFQQVRIHGKRGGNGIVQFSFSSLFFFFEHRSSTWGSQLNEINRAKRKLNDNKSLSSTIHLLSVSHLGNYNPTDEKEKLLQTNCNPVLENVGEKRRALIKENETLGHGYFEDEELGNVVQDLVISRYVARNKSIYIYIYTYRLFSRSVPADYYAILSFRKV